MDEEKNYNNYITRLGKNIKAIRKKAGYTQEQMAEELGSIDYKYYQRIESGKANITMKTLVRICDKLNTTPKDLFLTDETKY